MCLGRAHGRPSAGHSRRVSPGWKDVAPESLVCVCRVCRVPTQFTVVFWPVATA